MKTKRESLERAIKRTVQRAMKEGQVVDINTLAITLSSKYPQSGLTLDTICGQIEAIVAARQVEFEQALHR